MLRPQNGFRSMYRYVHAYTKIVSRNDSVRRVCHLVLYDPRSALEPHETLLRFISAQRPRELACRRASRPTFEAF